MHSHLPITPFSLAFKPTHPISIQHRFLYSSLPFSKPKPQAPNNLALSLFSLNPKPFPFKPNCEQWLKNKLPSHFLAKKNMMLPNLRNNPFPNHHPKLWLLLAKFQISSGQWTSSQKGDLSSTTLLHHSCSRSLIYDGRPL